MEKIGINSVVLIGCFAGLKVTWANHECLASQIALDL